MVTVHVGDEHGLNAGGTVSLPTQSGKNRWWRIDEVLPVKQRQ